ncbi:MAG: DNA mismatch repair endonuclease MutL [Gammaproteobacteria bacterium]|nr:DNA mismatch repair endonuclease MutL [Gammaproteobacteria bacterium]
MSQPVPSRPIQALADDLINQIAAGEVIERPVSIVKELIENSLDAGASAIKVELVDGGIERISVSDDGQGIPPLELALALRRHCTSKITRFDDLDRIVSLGFRGEALASIGAVAELTLSSRIAGAENAWSVTTGPRREITQPIPAARARGTTITVSNLFATIPARRQFLRRPQTELLHIQQTLRGIAFCVPGVALSLRYDSNKQWTAAAARDDQSNLQRWQAVFGAQFARESLYVDVTAAGIRLYGWIGPPRLARNQADLQYLAVNGRLIRDRQLAHAIRLAYGTDLGPGQFASYALHLEVASSEVDVNVHPSKAEVRFRQVRDVHDLIYAALRQALAPNNILARSAEYAPHALAETAPFHVAERVAAQWDPVVRDSPARPALVVEQPSIVANRFHIQANEAALRIVDLQRLVENQLTVEGTPEIRTLVFPVRLPTPITPWAVMSTLLDPYGFEFAEIGPAVWVLRGVPACLPTFVVTTFAALLAADKLAETQPRRAVAQAVCASLEVPSAPEREQWLRLWADLAQRQGVQLPATSLDAAALAHLCATANR